MNSSLEGILLIDKPKDKSSFYLVKRLRHFTKVKKIGHAGTLDPFATGLMILLIGKNYTKQSDLFLHHDKTYETVLHLGFTTESYDKETPIFIFSEKIPSLEEVKEVIESFQGEQYQTPPMFSAKKINGTPLYELARKGQTIERKPCKVNININLLDYNYPFLKLSVTCSKGTYIRSLGNDLGLKLGCGAYLTELRRIRSGNFQIEQSLSLSDIENNPELIEKYLIQDPV